METKGQIMADPPRLGILIPEFPGQTHIFFWREIRALEAMGVPVELLSTRKPAAGLIAHDWSEAAMARTTYLGAPRLGAAASALPGLPWGELLAEVRRDGMPAARDIALVASASRQLVSAARSRGIAHVHAHSCGRAALIAAFAQRLGGPSYSLTLHGPLRDYGPAQRFKWRRAAFGTVITRRLLTEIGERLAGDLPERLFVRPMGVDTEVLRRDAAYAPPVPGGPLRVFSCARLNLVKGHQHLLQAIRILRDAGVDARLEIAGEDDMGGTGFRAVLEARIAELGLEEHAHLLGAIDADRVKAKLLEAHVFALASFSEPLGVAYMEAMACGVPTIGTDAGGVPELIEDGVDGLLVSPQAPEELAAAIRALAEDPALAERLAAAGRSKVEQGYRASLGAELLRDEFRRITGTDAAMR